VAICKSGGVTLMDCRVAAVTWRTVEPDTAPIEATIVELPAVKVVARPELLTVATLPTDDVHVALLVMSCVLASEKVPLAVNCCVDATGTEGFAGITVIETITAVVTVRTELPVMEPEVAEMVALPAATVLAKPVLSTAAIVASDELHAKPDIFWVPPSVNSPTAVNCSVFPRANEGADGVSDIETRAAGSTVKVVEPDTEPEVAVIVTLPTASVVATPALSTETVLLSDEVQITAAKTCVPPSLKTPLAVNGWVSP